jgi:DnaA family protein
VRLRDDATFINYYPGANAAALGYVERLCEADAGWTESLIYLWGKQGVGRTHLLQAACLRFEQRASPVYLPLANCWTAASKFSTTLSNTNWCAWMICK